MGCHERRVACINLVNGLSIKGFEGEFLKLISKINQRRIKGEEKGVNAPTKFDREMKILEWTIKDRDNRKSTSKGKEMRDSFAFLC